MAHGPDEFLHVSAAEWRARVEVELKGADYEETLVSHLPGDIEVRPFYDDLASPANRAGLPGLGLLTRGATAGGPADGLANAPLQATPQAEDWNRQLLADLADGASGFRMVLDRPARLGRAGETTLGHQLSGVSSLDRALSGVPTHRFPWSIESGANGMGTLRLVERWLDRTGQPVDGLRLCLHHDPLAAVALDGALPGSFGNAWSEAARLVADAPTRLPAGRVLGVSTLPFHCAGAHAREELGIALAAGVETLRRLEEHDIAPHAVASQMVFTLALGCDFFTEIAKLRALRTTWSKLLLSCGIDSVPTMRVHCISSPRVLSRRDERVNWLRVTAQAFAASLGGADSFSAAPHVTPEGRCESADGTDGGATRLARSVARHSLPILQLEGQLERFVDPVGGSAYVEDLTDKLARGAWQRMQALERAGGLQAELIGGALQAHLERLWQRRCESLRAGDSLLTGVNSHPPAGTGAAPAAPATRDVARPDSKGTRELFELCADLDRRKPAHVARLHGRNESEFILASELEDKGISGGEQA